MNVEVNDYVRCKCGCSVKGKVLEIIGKRLVIWRYDIGRDILDIGSVEIVVKCSKLSKALE